MTNKEKFLELVSGTDTRVLEQIKWRVENRAWLNRSKAVAIRILSALKQKTMSQIELAKLLKVSPQQVNKWLRGKENFTFETISKLEAALQIELMIFPEMELDKVLQSQSKQDLSLNQAVQLAQNNEVQVPQIAVEFETVNDREEPYQIRFHDPYEWINSAKRHVTSAKCLEARINIIISKNPDIGEDSDFEFQSLVNSCLLLVGIAMENAIKGLIIATRKKAGKPDFKNINELNNNESGHKITLMYQKNCPSLYSIHKDYLERIQEYLFWIGKYSIPKDPEYLKLSTEYFNNDVKIASQIIDKVVYMIESE